MKTQQSGFTLLELLVVVAIIGVLAGLLFPSIAKIQEKGRVATCVSNLKQLHTGMMNYVNEHSGHMTFTASEEYLRVDKDGDEEWGFHRGWVDWGLKWDTNDDTSTPDPPALGNRRTPWWNRGGKEGLSSVTNGVLFPYVGNAGDEKVYVCPTMRRLARKKYKTDERAIVTRSYGMNAELQKNTWRRQYQNIGGPSRTLMFADQGFIKQGGFNYALENTGGNLQDRAFPGSFTKGKTYWFIRRSYRHYDGCIDWRGRANRMPSGAGGDYTYESIGEYHDGRANCVFCDGHVERIRYQGTRYICSGNWEEGRYFKSGQWYPKQNLVNE